MLDQLADRLESASADRLPALLEEAERALVGHARDIGRNGLIEGETPRPAVDRQEAGFRDRAGGLWALAGRLRGEADADARRAGAAELAAGLRALSKSEGDALQEAANLDIGSGD